MAFLRILQLTAFFSTLLVVAAGCNFIEEEYDRSTKKDLKKETKPPPKTRSKPPPPVAKKQLELKFSSGTNVTVPRCYVRLVAVPDRPSVVLVTTYEESVEETFPSILIKAQADSDDINQIVGKTLEAVIYYTKAQQGTVWRTPDGAPAVLTIRNVDDSGRVVGSIIKGSLINTDEPGQLEFTGAFDGKLL